MTFRKIRAASCYLAAIILLAWGMGRLYFTLTDGFSLVKIQEELAAANQPLVLDPALEPALRQKFAYLGKGCQSYVFASEDGQYVLKFFKFQHLRPYPLWRKVAFTDSFEGYLDRKDAEKARKKELLFQGCRQALANLPDETGVLFVHTEKTKTQHAPLRIVDKLGVEHSVPFDETAFMIQKRVVPSEEMLNNWMAASDEEGLRQGVRAILDVVEKSLKKGIIDRDPAVIQNIGFIGSQAVLIDVGQLQGQEFSPRDKNADYQLRCAQIEKWFESHAKPWLPVVQSEVKKHQESAFYKLPS